MRPFLGAMIEDKHRLVITISQHEPTPPTFVQIRAHELSIPILCMCCRQQWLSLILPLIVVSQAFVAFHLSYSREDGAAKGNQLTAASRQGIRALDRRLVLTNSPKWACYLLPTTLGYAAVPMACRPGSIRRRAAHALALGSCLGPFRIYIARSIIHVVRYCSVHA